MPVKLHSNNLKQTELHVSKPSCAIGLSDFCHKLGLGTEQYKLKIKYYTSIS